MISKLYLILIILPFRTSVAESGYDAWLRYPSIADQLRSLYKDLPQVVVTIKPTLLIESAQEELLRGLNGLLDKKLEHKTSLSNETAIILSTIDSIQSLIQLKDLPKDLKPDGFIIRSLEINGKSSILVTAKSDVGVLYGTFELLKKIGLHQKIDNLNETQNPYSPIRYTNEWDNLDGSIERGYSGRSIFFDGGNVVSNLSRANDYARLLASLGINGCTVNNVNANTRIITAEFLSQLKRLAQVFRRWGIKIAISVEFTSPQTLGKLQTFDPLNNEVIEWWNKKANEIYSYVPDLAGFVLKADSEGRLGPSAYNRTHADAANVLARALKPHNGVVFYRGFVYDHHMDWRNLKNDRARASYDNFAQLDGKFDENAIIQIKHGPIDFQVREPVSPIFGALNKTNVVIEFQVTQEYLGQQRHVVFEANMWKQVLDFDMKVNNDSTSVKSLVSGNLYNRPFGGFVAVINVGLDQNWLGHDLAMANLYAFGRLAWNPDLNPEEIVDEWTKLTFNDNFEVVKTVKNILLNSWLVYENYTGPLGVGTLTDIIGIHYGPGIESSEYNGWGQWHRADQFGIGMDRTVSTGTKYIGQYSPLISNLYESVSTCPDELLLFMHHVNYTHVLHSGQTLIQHIYDSHYSGAQSVQQFHKSWSQLKGKIDEQRFESVKHNLSYQLGHAVVWRDAVCQWFANKSGINDTKDRIGHNEGRIEAESMIIKGYEVQAIIPWETASGGEAISCKIGKSCSAEVLFKENSGLYDISIQYYDQNNGISNFKLFVSSKLISEWNANDRLPSNKPDGHTSTRHNVLAVNLKNGDNIVIEGKPDNGEHAVIDYIEILEHPSL